MIDETDAFSDGLDRTFLQVSSTLAEPFCWAYGMLRYRSVSPLDPNQFDNASSKAQEVATRVFIFLSAALAFAFAATHIAIAAIVLGAGSQMCRAIGFALQKNRFTHVPGLASEKSLENRQTKVMTWNLCGEYGGLSYKEGGVVHWRSRFDPIIEKIKGEDPDVIVLQEIRDTALVEALIQALQDRYAHFFIHLGGSAWERGSGCVVITKCAVAHFSHRDLSPQTGIDLFELKARPQDALPCVRFIDTQFPSGKEEEENRIEQVARIVRILANNTLSLPTLFIGTNAHLANPKEEAAFSKFFYPSSRASEPTHTEQFAIQWDPSREQKGETFDCISLCKRNPTDGPMLPVIDRNMRLIDSHVVEGFNKDGTQTPLSNHHGIATTLQFPLR